MLRRLINCRIIIIIIIIIRLIGKHVVDFILVLIELFSLGVTAEALQANGWVSVCQIFA